MKMQCRGCGEIKDSSEFYFVDGGLNIKGINDIKCEICKSCINDFNTSYEKRPRKRDKKYLQWQFIAPYFVAKMVIKNNAKLIKTLINNMENGYKVHNAKNTKHTAEMCVGNFLYIYYKLRFSHTNKTQEKIFCLLDKAKSINKTIDSIKIILNEDYKTIKNFKG